MTWDRRILGVGLGAATAVLVVAAGDAEARVRHLRPRRAPHRHRHQFKSAPAPTRAKTPGLDANGAADTSSKPVASAALQGGFRQDVVSGGALLAMSPDRALVLNSYRGLVLVDTSDPTAPRALASVAVDGAGERMLPGDGDVVVVSDGRDASGAWTEVAEITVGGSSLTVAGTAKVAGSLRDVARDGADLALVTSDSYVGPILYMNAAGKPGVASTAGVGPQGGAPSSNAIVAGGGASTPIYWGGPGKSHVARVRIGAGGAPSVLGTTDLAGQVLADAVSGTDAVLAVQSGGGFAYPLAGVGVKDPTTTGGQPGNTWTPPTVSLVRYQDDANGVPTAGASLALTTVSGIAAFDRDGTTLRALEYTDTGDVVATYDVSGAAPKPLGSLALSDWPQSYVFAGGAFVYATTDWNYQYTTPVTTPPDPVFDPTGASTALNGGAPGRKSANGTAAGGALGSTNGGASSGPTSTLHVVDLRDPANPALGGTLSGTGWASGMTTASGDVLVVFSSYSSDSGQSDLKRVDVSDPTNPTSKGELSLAGYVNLGAVLGDVLLVDGGTTDAATGAFQTSARFVDLSGGGLAPGGSVALSSWTAASARDGNLVALASYDRLTLVDVSEVQFAHPRIDGELRFVVNVAGFADLDAQTGAVLATDYVGGAVEIRTVSLPAADALSPLGVVKVTTGDAQMFAAAPFLYVVATDWSTGRASLSVVDASDSANPKVRGTLDLASYPGQVFLKGSALLLVRDASDLFVPTKSGRMKSAVDPFGACPKSWLQDGLAAVLDVVDLSNPDKPTASARLPIEWDNSSTVLLSGDSLYVPSYIDVTTPTGDDQYAYMVQEIDVTNPLSPSAGTPQDVPGELTAGTGAPHRVLTTDYQWDAAGNTTTSLNVVDLSLPANSRVIATTALSGYPDAVTVGGGRAYVVVEYSGDASSSASAQLATFDLSTLAVTGELNRDSGAYSGQIAAGCLFLRTWGWTGALDVYSLAAPDAPTFLQSQNVAGDSGDVVVVGGRAYAPGGLYGVQSFDLSK